MTTELAISLAAFTVVIPLLGILSRLSKILYVLQSLSRTAMIDMTLNHGDKAVQVLDRMIEDAERKNN